MKICLTFLFNSLLAFAAFAQPTNDDCTTAIDLGTLPYCSAPAEYTNVGATESSISPVNIPDCFNGGTVQRDVWFKFATPANGSITDFTVQVFGNDGANGTLKNPQVAVYRGDCPTELDMLACASAPNLTNTISVDLIGLTPGTEYFIRVNDYSASAASNAGTFKLCVIEFVADFIIGQVAGTSSCQGTLFDTGGENGDYSNDEDLSFTICPTEFHQCIILTVNATTEDGYDYLSFIQGDGVGDPKITSISGTFNNFEVQVPSSCATIQFQSDPSSTDEGFSISWLCTPTPCTAPPIITCDNPEVIPSLPYIGNNLDNCLTGNAIQSDPCASDFVFGNDYLFSYSSQGNECISINVNGLSADGGVGVYLNCPTEPGAACIEIEETNFNDPSNLNIEAAYLENAGNYYIMFSSAGPDCTSFNISIDTVTCPVVLPPASTCDQALNIGGCSNLLPQIIALNPGEGDPDFLQDGVNQGCFVLPQFNYSFFYFKAGADGKFGFTCEAANQPDEASDIDINVWGPIDNFEDICSYTTFNQPVRSTWTGGDQSTGLEDIHPETGIDVTDDYDCGDPSTPGAGGDRFVRRLDVIKDKYYVVLLDDFGEAIENGGIAIDFGNTTNGVLVPDEGLPMAGNDTTICLGQSAQLFASGGAAYFWSPSASLSCAQCPDPIASPSEPTTYEVSIATTCETKKFTVDVDIFDLDLGPNVTVCAGANFELNPGAPTNATYVWLGPSLSCNNCPSPTVGPLAPGTYTYVASLLTTFCLFKDTLVVTVLPQPQPQYSIIDDTNICAGESLSLGGVAQPGTTYSWSSNPVGFTASSSNPTASPTTSITYYLNVSNGVCPVPTVDSVVVEVSNSPILFVASDTSICVGEPILLGTTVPQANVTYNGWTSNVGVMDQPTAINPLESPGISTIYTFSATLGTCTISKSVNVSVVQLVLQLNVPDSMAVCQGGTVDLQVNVSPPDNPVTWAPPGQLVIGPTGLTATAAPTESTVYAIRSFLSGCLREVFIEVAVDSLPDDLSIMPSDTTVCQGQQILLKSPIYEPGEYQFMEFEWDPFEGQLTPDSLFNMVIVADTSRIYRRITRNGACFDTTYATINVIIPPPIDVIPPVSSVCAGVPVQLTATIPSGVEGIMWSPNGGLSCTDCPNPIATVSNTTTFTISGTYQSCPVSAGATINITQPPPLSLQTDVVLCKGESTVLNNFTAPNTTYNWTSTDPTFPGSTQAQPSVTPSLATTTYFVTATNGCPNTGSLTLTVIDAQLTVSNDTAVCRNEPVQISALGTQQGSFQWSNGQVGQTFTENIAATGTYTVTYTYGDGCTQTASVNVTVNGESVPLDIPSPTTLCPGESITLNDASVPAGATYVWTASPPDPTLGATSGNPTVQPSIGTTYTVTATLGICVTTRTVTIGIASGSLALPADITLCAGENATLTATINPAGPVQWSTGEQGTNIFVAPPATTTYIATYTYGNDCTITDSVKVTVLPGFELSIVSDPPSTDTLDLGDPLELTASISPGGNLQQYTFEWTENSVEVIGNTQLINTIVSTDEDTIRYIVRAVSPGGCVREASIGFRVAFPVVAVPNVFTPGNDMLNDTFALVFVEGSGIVEQMEIYNRWGQKVFNSSETVKTWDGTHNGKPAPVDTYVYRIIWRRKDGALQEPLTGEVTLLR
jgi:gliding motility-associated-like protein